MSQKVTLSNADKRYLPQIKRFLLEGKNQVEISLALHLRRETVNRKINRWMRTEDFGVWLKEVWLDLYGDLRRDDLKEAFRQVSKLLVQILGKEGVAPEETEKQELLGIYQQIWELLAEEEKDVILRSARILRRYKTGLLPKSQRIH